MNRSFNNTFNQPIMKTLFQQVLKAAKARVKKSALPAGRTNPAYKLNPAPAYWLLQPVHPQEIMRAKCIRKGDQPHNLYK